MKLLLENWRKFLKEDIDEDAGVNHNLFVDYIKGLGGDDEWAVALKNHKAGDKIHPKLNKKMHQEYKWNFPIDVAPGADCVVKIEALDRVVASFFRNPKMVPVEDASNPQELGENRGRPSPYEECRVEVTQKKRQTKSANYAATRRETGELKNYE
tara:strand:- start:40 stop:504 length:465 start_codon:yes stop_codon:yes gene_type:complete